MDAGDADERAVQAPGSGRAGAVVEVESWDPLHNGSPDHTYWSTSNAGEAMPGVLTPLGWSLWGASLERTVRNSFAALGAIPRRETAVPTDDADRCVKAFYGRAAASIGFIAYAADRLPGTNGAALAEQLLGTMPADLISRPTWRRYPVVAFRLPFTFVTIRGRLHQAHADTERWWARSLRELPGTDLPAAHRRFGEAWTRFEHNCVLQGTVLFGAIQPLYEQLNSVARSVGQDSAQTLMSGYGSHAEAAMVGDLWEWSRDRMTAEEFLSRHGYHGPREGEVSARVWREDLAPVLRLLQRYRQQPDEAAPAIAERRQIEARERAERHLLAALPSWRRPLVKGLIALARRYIPLRGIAKVAFLQSIDVARATARHIGTFLAAQGRLDDREDVFFLTAEELTGELPADLKDMVSRRRARFEHYLTLDLPSWWQGNPIPIVVGDPEASEETELTGLGVSPGVVEGRATVVLDPGAVDDDDTEILVASTTDPSWASLMYVSTALVADIGGAMSHTAIVARELGVPCVVNTQNGTRAIRTGDHVRVDGTNGTVTILRHADSDHAESLDAPALTTATGEER